MIKPFSLRRFAFTTSSLKQYFLTTAAWSDFNAIQCSNCLAKLNVRNAPTPGKKIICPKCKESFIVVEQEVLTSKPTPKKQAPPPVEDDEEELEETPKPNKKKKKQNGSGSGLATWLSIKKIKKRRPYQNKKYRVVDLLLNQHCNFPKWRWSWLNK